MVRRNRLYTEGEWARILHECGVTQPTLNLWAPVFADVVRVGTFSAGRQDIIAFLGQVLHESNYLRAMVESLNYRTPERLMAVWPSRFPTRESALPYVGAQRDLAEYVYGGRADLGNMEPGDGWKFRGRSPIHITGRANYALVGLLVGQDLTVMPELLEQPRFALEATIAWWENRVPDSMLGDPRRVTQRVNGGTHGLAQRKVLTGLAERAFA